MNTSKILVGIVVCVLFFGQAWLSAAGSSDANSAKTPTAKTPATTKTDTSRNPTIQPPPQQVIVTTPYVVRDNSSDRRTSAIEQNQRATDQQLRNLRQDLNAINTDLRALFEQNSKKNPDDIQVLQKLDRIEQMLRNINGRTKKLEDRVDQQDVKLRKLKNAQNAAPQVQESTDPNSATTGKAEVQVEANKSAMNTKTPAEEMVEKIHKAFGHKEARLPADIKYPEGIALTPYVDTIDANTLKDDDMSCWKNRVDPNLYPYVDAKVFSNNQVILFMPCYKSKL